MEWKLYESDFLNQFKSKINWIENELEKIRVGRVSPKLLENIQIEAYGVFSNLIELANISSIDARQLLIKPYDPTTTKNISSAINKMNLGASSQTDADSIRISFQAPTEEIRIDATKKVKKIIEQGKVLIRDIRHDILSNIKKDEILTEDDLHWYKNELDLLTKKSTKKLEEIHVAKDESIMRI